MRTSIPSSPHLVFGVAPRQRESRSALLKVIPLEVRNVIYQLVIEDAKNSKRWERTSLSLSSNQRFVLSIVPRLYDPPTFQIGGYGSLPLRQVNKQIYEELALQISFNVDRIRIGSYHFEYKESDPLIQWHTAFSLLENHRGLRKSVTYVFVKMPSIRDEMLRNSQLSVRDVDTEIIRKFDKYFDMMIPRLVKCLAIFQSIKCISFAVTVEKIEPPNFDALLPLLEICEQNTVVEMSPPQAGLRSYDPWISKWEDAWSICLRKKQREDLNLQAALLAF